MQKEMNLSEYIDFPVFADLITYYKSFMHTFNKTSDYRLA